MVGQGLEGDEVAGTHVENGLERAAEKAPVHRLGTRRANGDGARPSRRPTPRCSCRPRRQLRLLLRYRRSTSGPGSPTSSVGIELSACASAPTLARMSSPQRHRRRPHLHAAAPCDIRAARHRTARETARLNEAESLKPHSNRMSEIDFCACSGAAQSRGGIARVAAPSRSDRSCR